MKCQMVVICHQEQDVNKRGGAFKHVLIQKSILCEQFTQVFCQGVDRVP